MKSTTFCFEFVYWIIEYYLLFGICHLGFTLSSTIAIGSN